VTAGTQFRGKTGLRVNVGCGYNAADGHVNIDVGSYHPKAVFWDCRKNIDKNTGAVLARKHVFPVNCERARGTLTVDYFKSIV